MRAVGDFVLAGSFDPPRKLRNLLGRPPSLGNISHPAEVVLGRAQKCGVLPRNRRRVARLSMMYGRQAPIISRCPLWTYSAGSLVMPAVTGFKCTYANHLTEVLLGAGRRGSRKDAAHGSRTSTSTLRPGRSPEKRTRASDLCRSSAPWLRSPEAKAEKSGNPRYDVCIISVEARRLNVTF